jgi:hypothetical protein
MLNTTEESLYQFLKEHGNNWVKRELLLFWGMHPNTKYDRNVICYALDCSKLDAESALSYMVEEGLLDNRISNGVTLYSLTTNEDRRRPLLALAILGWDRWRLLLRRMEEGNRVAKYQDRVRGG